MSDPFIISVKLGTSINGRPKNVINLKLERSLIPPHQGVGVACNFKSKNIQIILRKL